MFYDALYLEHKPPTKQYRKRSEHKPPTKQYRMRSEHQSVTQQEQEEIRAQASDNARRGNQESLL